jgi:hypothetical protein
MARTVGITSPLGKPWRCLGTTMPPNTLLMCKLLLLLMVLHGFPWKISDPYIPFIPGLDIFRQQPGLFAWILKAAFFGASVALAFNFKVRTSAIVLGATVILMLLASKPMFRNHIFIVGCLLFLAGLHRRDEDAWLIKIQFGVMYLGAFLNKAFDSDWWTGRFMHHWLHGHLRNPFYESLSPLLPHLWFGSLLSCMVILSEFVLTILFFVPRWRTLGVWLAIAMHLGFLLVVGRRPFGYFTEDVIIGLLAFLSWPRTPMMLRMKPSLTIKPFLKFMNWDRQFHLHEEPKHVNHWLELEIEHRTLKNFSALACFFKYNCAFYVALFFAFNGIAFLIARYPF